MQMVAEDSAFEGDVEDRSDEPQEMIDLCHAFDVNVCPSSLPDIRPQELRIIGRVVSFSADLDTGGQRKSCAFKGWVGHITKDTVTLLDAIRFDDAAQLHDPTRTMEAELERFPIVLHRNPSGPSPVSVPPTAQPAGGNDDDGAAAAHRLPYATFPRRKLRNVKFETDVPVRAPSRSQEVEPFLDAVRAPQWFPHDAQKVRMFVRRYIVHTAQSNNNQRLSLMAFLLTRMTLPDGSIDAALLQRYVTEELQDLVTVDKEITARNEQQQQHQRARTDQANDRASAAAQRIRSGPVQLLHDTGLISRTTYVAIGVFACGIGLLLYSASVFTTTKVDFLLNFIRDALTLCVVNGVVFVISSICTALHVVGINSLPISSCKGCVRVFTTLAALAISAASIASLCKQMFAYQQIGGSSLFDYYLGKVAGARGEVCDMFSGYSCSGWEKICDSSSSSSVWARECPSPSCTTSFSVTCGATVEHEVRSQLLPLLIMSIVGGSFALLDALAFIRLMRAASTLARERPAAA